MPAPTPSQDPQAQQPQGPAQDAAQPGQPPQGDQGGEGQESPEQVAQDVGQGLMQLQAMAQKAGGAVKPQEMQLLNQAVQAFQQFYQSVSGGGQDQGAQPQPGDQGNVPMEAGAADVKPAP